LHLASSLRGRVEHQVDVLAGSANKVISGVVDTSFGVFRSLLPGTPDLGNGGGADSAPWNVVGPGFGLLRRRSGISIASIAASLPGRDRLGVGIGAGGAKHGVREESGRPLVVVSSSRPPSVTSGYTGNEGYSDDISSEGYGEGNAVVGEEGEAESGHDARSIKSFEGMMKRERERNAGAGARKSLSDRLAHMPGLHKVRALLACTLFVSFYPRKSRAKQLICYHTQSGSHIRTILVPAPVGRPPAADGGDQWFVHG
jgi:hypothetical protein